MHIVNSLDRFHYASCQTTCFCLKTYEFTRFWGLICWTGSTAHMQTEGNLESVWWRTGMHRKRSPYGFKCSWCLVLFIADANMRYFRLDQFWSSAWCIQTGSDVSFCVTVSRRSVAISQVMCPTVDICGQGIAWHASMFNYYSIKQPNVYIYLVAWYADFKHLLVGCTRWCGSRVAHSSINWTSSMLIWKIAFCGPSYNRLPTKIHITITALQHTPKLTIEKRFSPAVISHKSHH